MCKELQLPSSEYSFTADLVSVSSASALDSAPLQSLCVLALTVEGTARFWPSLSQEGVYSDSELDLGDLAHSVVAVRVRESFSTNISACLIIVLSSYRTWFLWSHCWP